MSTGTSGMLFDIKELTVHDGPGIRTTIFLKGCPLRCLWCHNPEGIRRESQLLITQNGCTDCGKCLEPCNHEECGGLGRCARRCPHGLLKIAGTRVSAGELADRMHRLGPLLVEGGITISGGEPLMQPAFLMDLLEKLRPLHTVVETSGYAKAKVFQQVAQACDIIYLDIKHADSAVHRRLTGVGNGPILENLRWMLEQEKPFLVRIPLIPNCNDDEENLRRTAELLAGCTDVVGVELMPLNPFSAVKYKLLEEEFPLETESGYKSGLPSAENPVEIFSYRGISCRVL